MAVRNANCHFISEKQLISPITRNRYCFNYCKETWHVDASNINSDSMFGMSTDCFLHSFIRLRKESIILLLQYCI